MNKQSANIRIALVAANWHGELVSAAVSSCSDELAKQGMQVKGNVEIFKAPGSLELPLISKLLAKSGKWDAIIAFGLIVDGGIYRHEFVAQAVIKGLVDVSLETQVPILSTVLTPQRFNETDKKQMAFLRSHLKGKGVESAHAAMETVQLTRTVTAR